MKIRDRPGYFGDPQGHSENARGIKHGRLVSCPSCAGSGRESGSSDPRQSVTCPRCGGRGVYYAENPAKTQKVRKVMEEGRIVFKKGRKKYNIIGQKIPSQRPSKFDKEGWSILKPFKATEAQKREGHRRWLERFKKGMSPEDADFSFRLDHRFELEEEKQKLMRQQHVEYGTGQANVMRITQLNDEAVARLKNKYGVSGF